MVVSTVSSPSVAGSRTRYRAPLKQQRPAPVCAGRAGLRIENSTTELRWWRPRT